LLSFSFELVVLEESLVIASIGEYYSTIPSPHPFNKEPLVNCVVGPANSADSMRLPSGCLDLSVIDAL